METLHLRLLIQLAKLDGNIDAAEVDLIMSIGKSNGLSEEEIKQLFNLPTKAVDATMLSDAQKFDYIYSMVQLMKVDGEMHNNELKFCSEMAVKLGYREGVLFELVTNIVIDENIKTDRKALRKKVKPYLLTSA